MPHYNTKSNFKSFISSFIVDIKGFATALLTIIMALVVIYIVTGHSKVKTLVANIALQCIKTVEAAALNPNHIICDSGLEKILLIIKLAIVTIMAFAKLRKSRVFKGKLFSNHQGQTICSRQSLLHTLTSKQISRQCTPFQTSQYTYKRKSSLKEKLDMGCLGNRLDRCVFITGP